MNAVKPTTYSQNNEDVMAVIRKNINSKMVIATFNQDETDYWLNELHHNQIKGSSNIANCLPKNWSGCLVIDFKSLVAHIVGLSMKGVFFPVNMFHLIIPESSWINEDNLGSAVNIPVTISESLKEDNTFLDHEKASVKSQTESAIRKYLDTLQPKKDYFAIDKGIVFNGNHREAEEMKHLILKSVGGAPATSSVKVHYITLRFVPLMYLFKHTSLFTTLSSSKSIWSKFFSILIKRNHIKKEMLPRCRIEPIALTLMVNQQRLNAEIKRYKKECTGQLHVVYSQDITRQQLSSLEHLGIKVTHYHKLRHISLCDRCIFIDPPSTNYQLAIFVLFAKNNDVAIWVSGQNDAFPLFPVLAITGGDKEVILKHINQSLLKNKTAYTLNVNDLMSWSFFMIKPEKYVAYTPQKNSIEDKADILGRMLGLTFDFTKKKRINNITT